MALPAVSRTSARLSPPPRPSISPLSSPSIANKSSPVATRDAAMQDLDAEVEVDTDNDMGDAENQIAEQLDDRSSSLSDPEDENEDHAEQNGIDGDMADAEELTAQRSLEVDSEAETEIESPHRQRQHADSIGRTPSKLSQAATVEEGESEPPSPVPIGAGAASSTSTVATAGQKRKRDGSESSLTSAESESPRKRSHEMRTKETLDEVDTGQLEEEVPDMAEVTPAPGDAEDAPDAVPTKGLKGRKGKQKGRPRKGTIEEADGESTEDVAQAEEEPSEENTAKTEEELKAKQEAMALFEDVTKHFRAFKEKLYNERLAAITTELQLLSEPNCEHPEFLRQVACVNARLQKQNSETRAYYSYKSRCIRDRTLGERSQLHSQYYQHARELREDVLYKLGEDWYAIQKERRQSHQEKDDAHLYKFPTKKSVQIRNQAKYNQEVSILSGVAKYVGFPAAPEITGAEGADLEDDLKAMKISKRIPQPTAAAQTVYLPNPPASNFSTNERLAHEQFIEQNPWARPQAPIHNHGTPAGISHTPDWAEASTGGHNATSAKHLIRNLSGRNASPFATPMPQKRNGPLELSSAGTVPMNSDGATEPPSSVLAAPPTESRISLLSQHHQQQQPQNHGSSQPSSPITLPNPKPHRELTGFRNISGTSTIDAHPASDPIVPSAHPPPQIFDTSQLHLHGAEEKVGGGGVYATAGGFRPQEGAFGTPAPLQP